MEGKLLKETPTFWAKVWEYAKSILIALIIALLIRTFIVQAFRIPSGSMIPTLLVGDHILVNKLAYRFGEPHRLDVVVFKFPLDSKKDYIKRVIGLPGDRLKIVNKVVF
ncbi:MAG: signal peptidase I, partial [Aquificota bacterium]